jgi:hypothetical protein
MNWRPLLVAAAIINGASILALIVASFFVRSGAIDMRIVFALVGLSVVTLPAIIIPAFRRRMARGGSRRVGLGVGIVDVIEGVSGKELSSETAMKIRWIAVGLCVLLLAVGVALAYMRSDFTR